MSPELVRILRWLLQNAKNNEWQTRHAAENTYCPYCADIYFVRKTRARRVDDYTDQKDHHPDCEYVKMVAEAERLLEGCA